MADSRRFFDPSLPQTLQGAVMLCYITAAFGIIKLLFGDVSGFPAALLAVGGFGVANEKRWGYVLAIVLAGVNVLTILWAVFGGSATLVLNLLFAGVLMGLLLHPQSRHYQRIWFH